jgi:hypothetical protein
MLQGERQSHDRERQQHRPQQVMQGDQPSEGHEPDHVEHEPQRRIGVLVFDQLATKGGQRGDAELDLLIAERNADHRQAQEDSRDNVGQPGHEPAAHEPNHVAHESHGSSSPLMAAGGRQEEVRWRGANLG